MFWDTPPPLPNFIQAPFENRLSTFQGEKWKFWGPFFKKCLRFLESFTVFITSSMKNCPAQAKKFWRYKKFPVLFHIRPRSEETPLPQKENLWRRMPINNTLQSWITNLFLKSRQNYYFPSARYIQCHKMYPDLHEIDCNKFGQPPLPFSGFQEKHPGWVGSHKLSYYRLQLQLQLFPG